MTDFSLNATLFSNGYDSPISSYNFGTGHIMSTNSNPPLVWTVTQIGNYKFITLQRMSYSNYDNQRFKITSRGAPIVHVATGLNVGFGDPSKDNNNGDISNRNLFPPTYDSVRVTSFGTALVLTSRNSGYGIGAWFGAK